VRRRIIIVVAILQSTLFLAHWFVYETWAGFWGIPDPSAPSIPEIAVALLSVTFVVASLLAFRYNNILVRLFYVVAAVWLGVLSFCFLAACSCQILYSVFRVVGIHLARRPLAAVFFGLAILASLYGMINASLTRVRRITIMLPNLPASWRGRVAALVTDTHLGHVRGYGFGRKIAKMLNRARPDIVFMAGDLYDGTAADVNRLAEPWAKLSVPLGTYFVTGNHEEFSDRRKYLAALRRAGIRILENEKVTVDGLQIVGVHYREAANSERFRAILQGAALDHTQASVLLTHAPHRLSIPEEEAVSLQLSGHTHGGQFFPFTLVASRVYGRYARGLKVWGRLKVYTSSGAGTWGPPLRLGTNPEVVLIQFA
jgi:predicted MPP superfamily phosphohydrolase